MLPHGADQKDARKALAAFRRSMSSGGSAASAAEIRRAMVAARRALAAGGSEPSCQLGSSTLPVGAGRGKPASRLPALALAVQLAVVSAPPSASPLQQASAAAASASSVLSGLPITRGRLRWPASLCRGDEGAGLSAAVSSTPAAALRRSGGGWPAQHPCWAAFSAGGLMRAGCGVCRQREGCAG